MLYPTNDEVKALAIVYGHRLQYNESLFDALSLYSDKTTLPDLIRDVEGMGFTLQQLYDNGFNTIRLPLGSSLVPELSVGSPTPTFTRATTAYVQDWEAVQKPVLSGEPRYVGARRVRNLSTTSSLATDAAWGITATATKVGVVAGIGPNGEDAEEISFGAAAASAIQNFINGGNVSGNKYVSRLLVRAKTGSTTIRGMIWDTVTFSQSSSITITTDWVEISHSLVAGTTGAGVYGVTNNLAGNSANIYVIHGQIEDVTGQTNQNPSEYVSVGVLSAPYHGAGVDGVKYFNTLNGNTVASNVVTEATGAAITPANGASALTTDTGGPFGYLSEGSRTNLFIQSNDFTNVAWVKTTMTTAKTSTGPDGIANSATRLTATGALALVKQLLVAAASDRTWSVWARRVTGTGTIKLFQGATKTADLASQLNSTTYTQIQLDATVDIGILGAGIEIGTNTDAIDVWCGQFEAGAFASTPIPTTTVAVTRNSDILSYVSTGNISGTQGSVYSEITIPVLSGTQVLISGGTGVPLYVTSGATRLYDGTAVIPGPAISASPNVQKTGSRWTTGAKAQVALGGSIGTETAYDGDINTIAIQIGYQNTGNHLFGTIRNVKIFPTALSAAQLQALTA